MAILSKRRHGGGPSHGHDFDRIEDKIHGLDKWRINRCKDIFSSDYIYIANNTTSEEDVDVERGVNKSRHRFHDLDWCNEHKDERGENMLVTEQLDALDISDDEILDMMDELAESGEE